MRTILQTLLISLVLTLGIGGTGIAQCTPAQAPDITNLCLSPITGPGLMCSSTIPVTIKVVKPTGSGYDVVLSCSNGSGSMTTSFTMENAAKFRVVGCP